MTVPDLSAWISNPVLVPDLSWWFSSDVVAVVSCAGSVSFVRDPGDRDDDALRAAVNAPAVSTVMRIRQPELTGPSLHLISWSCHVCGRERYDAHISVAYPQSLHNPGGVFNVRYCNDRDDCVAVAGSTSPWPPTVAQDRCIAALGLHCDPHKGCVLR